MSRSHIARISVGIAGIAAGIVLALTAPLAGASMVSADDGTSQPPPAPTPDGHGWGD